MAIIAKCFDDNRERITELERENAAIRAQLTAATEACDELDGTVRFVSAALTASQAKLAAVTEERERLRAMLSEALDEWGYWFSNADQADYDKRDIAKWRARIDEMRAALAEGGS